MWATAAVGVTLVLASAVAVRKVPWFGPMLADNLRSVVGSERVTQLEELVAHVEDRVHQQVHDGRVRTLTESTPDDLSGGSPSRAQPSELRPSEKVTQLRPRDVTPMYASVASAEDGLWQPVNLRSGNEVLYRTILHPDSERAYTELFVFAFDISRFEWHAVAGSVEPKSPTKLEAPRPGVIPASDHDRLVVAFNGGFKAEHGHFGMMADGVELLAPRPKSCTFAALDGGQLQIGTWATLESAGLPFVWWRQTPGCMLENGVLHPGLRSEDSKNWGATQEGKTVIRRSAVGLSEDQKILYVAIGNSVTARALALGMQHAGANSVAQLDVNYSFPRILLYRENPKSGELQAQAAIKDLLYQKDEYLQRASPRDFFYVTTRAPERKSTPPDREP